MSTDRNAETPLEEPNKSNSISPNTGLKLRNMKHFEILGIDSLELLFSHTFTFELFQEVVNKKGAMELSVFRHIQPSF